MPIISSIIPTSFARSWLSCILFGLLVFDPCFRSSWVHDLLGHGFHCFILPPYFIVHGLMIHHTFMVLIREHDSSKWHSSSIQVFGACIDHLLHGAVWVHCSWCIMLILSQLVYVSSCTHSPHWGNGSFISSYDLGMDNGEFLIWK